MVLEFSKFFQGNYILGFSVDSHLRLFYFILYFSQKYLEKCKSLDFYLI